MPVFRPARRGRPLAAPPTRVPPPPPDLMAAAAARLLAWPGLAAALGHSALTPKVWSDAVLGSPGLPWVRVNEPMGSRRYVWNGFRYTETGQLQLDIFAAGKLQARQLGWMVAGNTGSGAGALDDPPLVFSEGTLLYLRLARKFFSLVNETGPGVPAVYHLVMLFDYQFSGAE